MSTAKERKSKAAEEMKLKLQDREEARLEAEQATLRDLNQGMQDPGAHDATHRGIRWGPSYRIRGKRAKPKQASENQKKESDSKA